MEPTASKTVLVTGFEPFGGESSNPSEQLAERLSGRSLHGWRVASAVLPVTFAHAASTLLSVVARERPSVILCLGQVGGTSAIRLERLAINLCDAPMPDNGGAQPREAAIVEDGPVGYWSTLPLRTMARAIKDTGIAVELSSSAGTYVCNHVFYSLMHALRDAAKVAVVQAGFVHVPYAREQGHATAPSIPLHEMECALRASIEALVIESARNDSWL